MKYLDSALSLIAPHHCLNCNEEGSVCCQKCLDQIADKSAGKVCYKCNQGSEPSGICQLCQPEQSLDSVAWYANYNNPIASELVKSLKFNNLYEASNPISDALASQLKKIEFAKSIITSAPTAGKRFRARGWDQARLIAKRAARKRSISYKSLIIRASSFDQIGSTKNEILNASKKFFKVHRKSLIKNKKIIVIDDVMTTGSTLNAAAKKLKEAGAKEVHGLVFVRQGLSN